MISPLQLASNDLRDYIDYLEPKRGRHRYECPACGDGTVWIDPKSGKYGSNCECHEKRITNGNGTINAVLKATKQLAGVWVDLDDAQRSRAEMEEIRRAAQKRHQQREQEERQRLASFPSLAERQALIEPALTLPLSDRDRQKLRDRGFTDAAIDHHQFYSGADGIVGFVRDIDGKFTARFKRLHNPRGGKYLPVSNRAVGGDDYGLNLPADHYAAGDLPLSHVVPTQWHDRETLYIVESSIIKCQLAAELFGAFVLGHGGAGGRLDRCAKQIEAAIERHGFKRVRLLPDAGWEINKGIAASVRSLVAICSELLPTSIGDWGQARDKAIGSIDDIDADRLASIQWRPGAELLPADPIARFAPRSKTITRDQWIEKFGQTDLCDLNRAVRRSGAALDFFRANRAEKAAKHSPTAIKPDTTCTAITVFDTTKQEHPIEIGQPLPTRDEWIALGRPILTIDPADNQADRWLELAALGYKVAFASDETGRGKSHVAGELGQRVARGKTDFGRLIYFSSAYRNPSTESIETAIEMPTRHNGLATDYLRRTPSGQPFRTRPKLINGQTQTPDIPGNCPKSDVFAAAAGRDVKLFGGKESPICQGCPQFSSCEFLRERGKILSEGIGAKFIRADLSQFATLKPTDIAIVDEADTEIQATKAIEVSLQAIAAELQAINDAIEAHHAQIIGKAIYDGIATLLSGEQGEYGLTHLDMIEGLPTLNRLRFLLPSRGQGWVASRDIDEDLVRRAKATIDRVLKPNLDIFGQDETPDVQLERLKNVHVNVIGKVLDVVLGNRSIDLASRSGKLIITRRNRRPGRTIQSAGFSVLMDATGNKRDLARKLGINADEVVEIRSARSDYSNLTIQIVQGVGSCGRKRRDDSPYAAKQRIDFLLDHLNPDAHIDYMGKADRYWFRDNRGSNEFKSCNHIAAAGLPTPNLGASSAEWHALTGYAVNPTDRTGGYGSFIRRLIAAEILQLIGRPRSQWRPDEQITVTLIGDGFVAYQKEIAEQFPGASIKVIDVIDICPIAATKGEQTAHAIVNNIVSFGREGKAITRKSLGQSIGHSNPSKALKDRFGLTLGEVEQAVTFVLEALNTKVTVDWSAIPEQLKALLHECFGLAESMQADDPDTAALLVLDVIETARAEFGDEATIAAIGHCHVSRFAGLLALISELMPVPIVMSN